MDIKKLLYEIINSKTYYSYIAIEKLIFIMLNDYLVKQGKNCLLHFRSQNFIYDILLPDGIDNITGKVAVEIKMYRNPHMSKKIIYNIMDKILMKGQEIDALLFIIVNEIPEAIRKKILEKENKLNFELLIWDIDNLIDIFKSNEKLFIETYNNLNTVLLQDTISSGIARKNETYLEKRKKYIQQLHEDYKKDNIVLFLGAGASKDAKIATWETLVSELFVALIDKQLKANHIKMREEDKKKILREIVNQNGSSPLLQTRFLRNGFEDDFVKLVGEILYKNAVETSDTLEEIGQLCIPNRGKIGVQAIINYNFDDLIEKNLKRLRVEYHSIYGEGMIPDSGELGIYHVHGFLPQDKDGYENLTKSLLVFSEEGYHKLLLESYNWANISQLNFIINNTCVFIGLSMTDPNMRRLLEVAVQKRIEEDGMCKHYAIISRFNIKDSEEVDAIKSFERVNESLQESFFRELGINVIWIDTFNEIPIILKQIKGSLEQL